MHGNMNNNAELENEATKIRKALIALLRLLDRNVADHVKGINEKHVDAHDPHTD